jgi:5'-deoxynucleotidase YfbR-like HD superfamily hydrolase
MSESVRPRIMDFLARQDGFVHVGGIARGAQVSAPSVRMVLRELEQAGRLEVRPAGDMPGPTGPGYRLCKTTAGGPHDIGSLADAVTELGGLATLFAAVNRTCCYWPDQVTPESDSDHTVMLAWIAPAVAALLYPGRLDTGLVAEFAVLHDAVEVFAGDTPTLRITSAGLAAKAAREKEAAREWHRRFSGRLPWVADRIRRYERQEEPEARFVRAVDKQLTRIVHMGDRCAGLHEIGMTTAELAAAIAETSGRVAAYAADFPELLALGDELARRTLAVHAQGPGQPGTRNTRATMPNGQPTPPRCGAGERDIAGEPIR